MLKFTKLYPFRTLLHKDLNSSPYHKEDFGSIFLYIRGLTGKDEKPSGPAKEEQMTIKMPGFIHPENMKEEGYFTQMAKKQLEELKRKGELPTVGSSDKKE